MRITDRQLETLKLCKSLDYWGAGAICLEMRRQMPELSYDTLKRLRNRGLLVKLKDISAKPWEGQIRYLITTNGKKAIVHREELERRVHAARSVC